MSCIQQQSPTSVHGKLPALRINTDLSNLREASFEEINSAPVTRKELGFQDVTQYHQYSPSVAFTSNNGRSTMTVPPAPPGTNSSTDELSPDRIFSNEDALANTSGSSEHRASPVNQGEGNIFTRGRNGSVSSPLASEASSGSTSSGSTRTPPDVKETVGLARIISHGYSTVGTLNEKAPGSPDRMDIFEVLPAALNAEGRVVCQHHKARGACDCEAFPLVKINFPPPMPRNNRVCYPIQEVDEPQTEPQPVVDVGCTHTVSPTTVKAREVDEKRQLEAERFETLLEKLRKSAPTKERKDPVAGRSERPADWGEATSQAWDQRFNVNKSQVCKGYAHGTVHPTMKSEQSAISRQTVPKQPERGVSDPSKPSVEEPKPKLPESKLRKAWNPKAKEFLPPKVSDAPAGKAAGARARELLSKFVSEAKSRDESHGNKKESTNVAGATASPLPFVPQISTFNDTSTLTPPLGVTPSLAQMFPSIGAVALPALTMPGTTSGGLGSLGVGGSKFDFNPVNVLGALNNSLGAAMAGVPGVATPALAGLAGANLGGQRPWSQMFPAAVNAMPPTPSRAPPGPVPKPRLPDAQAQQQYEQWIEWRKANEPGYALECKARQARRAQRTKPTTGSSLKTEPRGGTDGDGSSTGRNSDSKVE
ncbi:hypothetical protein VUR80DRAFT_347 [Thermomyces stellatus]